MGWSLEEYYTLWVLSTVLQGFCQSNKATVAACQVNNLHLIRAMNGRPGAAESSR
jgi:hypothetical protein